MEIKDYIETRIKKHKTAAESLRATTSDLINVPKYAIPMLQRYAPAAVASTIQEQIDTLIGKQVALDQLFAAEITQHIKNARRETLPDAVRNRETPADYQAQISNALAFLQAAGGQLTDDEAFDILKPFFNDWEHPRSLVLLACAAVSPRRWAVFLILPTPTPAFLMRQKS